MKKTIFFFSVLLYFTSPFLAPTYADDFKLNIHDFTCEEEEIVIHYSVINYINFDRQNVSLVFKIMKEEKPIACRELILTITKGADGSEINELIIDAQCEGKAISLKSSLFHDNSNYNKQQRIDQFFSRFFFKSLISLLLWISGFCGFTSYLGFRL